MRILRSTRGKHINSPVIEEKIISCQEGTFDGFIKGYVKTTDSVITVISTNEFLVEFPWGSYIYKEINE